LLATYDFIDFGGGFTDVNNNPNERNDWVLDLNAGLDLLSPADPSPFANRCKPTVIYADGYSTPTWVSQILSGGDDVLFNFDDYQAGDVEPGIPWFAEGPSKSGGDKTVPQFSSIGQFVGDPRVTLKRISAGNPDHTGLMSNVDAQKTILETIDTSYSEADISTGEAPILGGDLQEVVSVISDPVDSFLIDGKGRRLGYSEATGVVNEIPGGSGSAIADGAGWIFGDIERPLRVELTGRGELFYYIASVNSPDADGGVVDSGFL
jgi:hypothetical protein